MAWRSPSSWPPCVRRCSACNAWRPAMQDRLRLLSASRNQAAPPRQQTLRAALQWSHGFLDARERAVFRRLGVMAGSASLELIQQTVADPENDPGLDAWAILDALGLLVDRSLVAVLAAEADDEAPRYRLLDSTRAFALEELEGVGRARGRAAAACAGDGGVVRCGLRRVLQRPHRCRRVDAAARRRPRQRARRVRLGAPLRMMRARELAIARARCCTRCRLRCMPSAWRWPSAASLASARRCPSACSSAPGSSSASPGPIRRRSAAAKPRSDRSHLARSLDHQHDRFTLYFALSRAASAAAQDGDVEAAGAPLAELQAPRRSDVAGAPAALGCRGGRGGGALSRRLRRRAAPHAPAARTRACARRQPLHRARQPDRP